MKFLLLQGVHFLQVKDADDLSQWEFVDVIDAEEEPDADEDEESVVVSNGTGSPVSSISRSFSSETGPIDCVRPRLVHSDDANLTGRIDVDRRFEDVEADDDDDNDGFDLDDELVPWSVNGKFGRQRMRKLGKRAFSKMNNSKRSPYLFVRPGCVRGKHGLGLKHNC